MTTWHLRLKFNFTTRTVKQRQKKLPKCQSLDVLLTVSNGLITYLFMYMKTPADLQVNANTRQDINIIRPFVCKYDIMF